MAPQHIATLLISAQVCSAPPSKDSIGSPLSLSLTAKGLFELTVLLVPSWPLSFLPQHASAEPNFASTRAQACKPPAPIAYAHGELHTPEGPHTWPVAHTLGLNEHWPASQLSVVQGSWSSQAAACAQPCAAETHLSVVHTLPSSQLSALTQPPFAQLSVVHLLLSSQVIGVPLHTPLAHWSPWVQPLESEQAPPTGVRKHCPLAGLHAPCWQLAFGQTVATPAVHLPALQTSLAVHELPSSHFALLAAC